MITEGDHGDCYYAVADGELSVTRRGRIVRTLSRGDGFGELALIRDIPRQATVTATTDVLMYRIRKEPFIETLSGHTSAASTAKEVISGYEDDDVD